MASHAMNQGKLPKHAFNDLIRFIHEKYQGQLPNSLIVAQAFILEYRDLWKRIWSSCNKQSYRRWNKSRSLLIYQISVNSN